MAVPYPASGAERVDEDGAGAAGEAREPGSPDADDASDGRRAAVDGDVTSDGPPIARIRELLASRTDGMLDRGHLLADLTEDGSTEVVVATVDGEHEAAVEVARWSDGGEFERTTRVTAGVADRLGRLGLADLGDGASRVLTLVLRHDDATRLAVWMPTVDGGLRSPSRCPVDAVAVLRTSSGLRLRLACGDAGAGGDALVWREGAFRPGALDDRPTGELLDDDRPAGDGGPHPTG